MPSRCAACGTDSTFGSAAISTGKSPQSRDRHRIQAGAGAPSPLLQRVRSAAGPSTISVLSRGHLLRVKGQEGPSATAILGELVERPLSVSFGVSFVVGHRFEVGLGADGFDLGGEVGEKVGDLVEAVAVLALQLA
jgi:hypothetical protein